MTRLHLDFETFSETDLKAVGLDNYATHPSTEILMLAWQFNDGPVEQVSIAEGEDCPRDLVEAMTDPEVAKWAWNAPFEMAITRHVWGLPVDLHQWYDTMVLGHYCSFPGRLEEAGPALGLPSEACKDPDGKRLMRKFSMRKVSQKKANKGELVRTHWYDDVGDWQRYLSYNRQDVRVEHAIHRVLGAHDLPPIEWELWRLDQEINQNGLPINRAMVENAVRVYDAAFERGRVEMSEITGLRNPMSTQQLLPWLNSQGYPFADCKKGHIRQAAQYFREQPEHWEQDRWNTYRSNADLRDVLSLRLELSRTSIKKFAALQRATSEDGVLRNTLQFMGASRTGREAGRIFQPQNLPRPEKRFEKGIEIHAANVQRLDLDALDLIYDNVFDLLASCIRPAAQAPEGYVFADADLNAIENRVLGWLAGCRKILQVFENGLDPYISFATYLYREAYDKLWEEYLHGKSEKRTIAKPGVLGAGYRLGPGHQFENSQTGEIEATGLLGYAWNMGIRQFTQAQAEHSVKTFRTEFHEVKKYWFGIEDAARTCVLERRPVQFGFLRFDMVSCEKWVSVGSGRVRAGGEFLRVQLPSKRYLHYFEPQIRPTRMPWVDDEGRAVWRDSLTYMGVDDRKQWVRITTHGGKLTENVDQAISRDILFHGMRRAKLSHLDIRLHVHDQALVLVRADRGDRALAALQESLEDVPSWAPGLPLGSAGFTSRMFRKD